MAFAFVNLFYCIYYVYNNSQTVEWYVTYGCISELVPSFEKWSFIERQLYVGEMGTFLHPTVGY